MPSRRYDYDDDAEPVATPFTRTPVFKLLVGATAAIPLFACLLCGFGGIIAKRGRQQQEPNPAGVANPVAAKQAPTVEPPGEAARPPKKSLGRKIPANAVIVGEWEPGTKFMRGSESYNRRVTFYRDADGLHYNQEFADGSGPLDYLLVEGETPDGRTRYHRADRPEPGERSDDHFVIEADGSLVPYDNEGRVDHMLRIPVRPVQLKRGEGVAHSIPSNRAFIRARLAQLLSFENVERSRTNSAYKDWLEEVRKASKSFKPHLRDADAAWELFLLGTDYIKDGGDSAHYRWVRREILAAIHQRPRSAEPARPEDPVLYTPAQVASDRLSLADCCVHVSGVASVTRQASGKLAVYFASSGRRLVFAQIDAADLPELRGDSGTFDALIKGVVGETNTLGAVVLGEAKLLAAAKR